MAGLNVLPPDIALQFLFSRRRRTYIRVPKTDLGYLDFLLFARRQDFGQFWDFCFFEFFQMENRCVPVDSDATIGPVVAPWIVSKTLIVIGRGGSD